MKRSWRVMVARKEMYVAFLLLLTGLGGCGSGSVSGSAPPPPTPGISISPVSAVAGTSDLVLTVTGSNFVDALHNKSVVAWSVDSKDTFLDTTLVSSTQLTAVIPAGLLESPITAKVFVETRDLAGSAPLVKSGSVKFEVTAAPPAPLPALSISSISPMSVIAGSPDLMLTVMGTGFGGGLHNKSIVTWSKNLSETSLTTTFVSNTQLTAVIPAGLLESPTTAKVLVKNVDVMASFPSSRRSNSIDFSVTPP